MKNAEDVVDQAAATFAKLELQAQEQRDTASNIMQAAQLEFDGVKQIPGKEHAKHGCDGGCFGVPHCFA